MKTIYLEIENRMQKSSQESKSVLLWYNVAEKKMEKYCGSHLNFKYDFNTKKMRVNAGDAKSTVYVNASNKKILEDWIAKNASLVKMNSEESSSKSLAIDVEDNDYETVCNILDAQGFRYSE